MVYSDGKEPTVFIHVNVYVVIYNDYFVHNVYRACAYIEINFTTSMIQQNFDVNVLSSDFSCLIFFLSSPENNNEMRSSVLFIIPSTVC